MLGSLKEKRKNLYLKPINLSHTYRMESNKVIANHKDGDNNHKKKTLTGFKLRVLEAALSLIRDLSNVKKL